MNFSGEKSRASLGRRARGGRWPLLLASASVFTIAALQSASAEIEVVTVTAERRAENAQNVPIPITSLTDEQLQKGGVVHTGDLVAVVPGLQFSFESDTSDVYLRGVGTQSNPAGEEGSVAFYLDDVYVPWGAASIFQLNSISSVDVLKGPQGTLYGRNATGGVINIATKDPSSTFGLDAHAGYGNYNTPMADLYVTGEIANNLTANISLYGRQQNSGWGHDIVSGIQTYTNQDGGVQGKLLWEPDSATTIRLSGGYSVTEGSVGIVSTPLPSFVAAGGPGCPGPVGFYDACVGLPTTGTFHHGIVSLKITHDMGWAQLVSISAGQSLAANDHIAEAGAVVVSEIRTTGRAATQELQLLSENNSPVKWVVGAFYMYDRAGFDNQTIAGPAVGFPINHMPTLADPALLNNGIVTTNSIAGYGEATYEIFPATNLTAGLRFTDDRSHFVGSLGLTPAAGGGNITGVPCATGLCPFSLSKQWDQWTYRAILDHHFSDNFMAYASFNRGFKSGEFDSFGTSQLGPAEPPVKPEVVYAYEAGFKSDLLNGNLRLNGSAFYYDYKNIQLEIIHNASVLLLNASTATIRGVELQADYSVTPQLTLSASASLQHGTYGNFFGPAFCPTAVAPQPLCPGVTFATGGELVQGVDLTGFDTIETPRFSSVLSANYDVPTASGPLDFHVSWSFIDPYSRTPDAVIRNPTTNLLAASINWTLGDGRYDVRLWGRNLTGAQYFSYSNEGTGTGLTYSAQEPRMFGVTFGLHL